MSKVFRDIKIPIDESLEEKLQLLEPNYSSFRILKKSVDARKRHQLHFVYSVEVFESGETPSYDLFKIDKIPTPVALPVVIVGAGPAGLFAALRLAERGIPVTLLDRGSSSEQRMKLISRYWRYGDLHPENNVCFGEGGAGLYSDGKLITRIKSPHIPYVMRRLVDFGAPGEIEYLSNPHVGSDKIRRVIPIMRRRLIELGVNVRYDSKLVDFQVDSSQQITQAVLESGERIDCHQLILASGHSATDIFELLAKHQVFMEGKSFAVGLRIEHDQSIINKTQYKKFAEHPQLGAANYKLAHHDKKTNTGVFSFCMCPGGYVLGSSTENDGIVCNGMSNYKRNSPYANSAIVVTIDFETHFKNQVFAGLNWRREIERNAFKEVQQRGGKMQLPAQKITDFINGRLGDVEHRSSLSREVSARLDLLIPNEIKEHFLTGLENFEKKMPGFMDANAQLYGMETRTSCPIRVTRDQHSLESISHSGLFPCGEGAGYAGGITSAACDGVKVADKIFEKLSNQKIATS